MRKYWVESCKLQGCVSTACWCAWTVEKVEKWAERRWAGGEEEGGMVWLRWEREHGVLLQVELFSIWWTGKTFQRKRVGVFLLSSKDWQTIVLNSKASELWSWNCFAGMCNTCGNVSDRFESGSDSTWRRQQWPLLKLIIFFFFFFCCCKMSPWMWQIQVPADVSSLEQFDSLHTAKKSPFLLIFSTPASCPYLRLLIILYLTCMFYWYIYLPMFPFCVYLLFYYYLTKI